MDVQFEELIVDTSSRTQMVNITRRVREVVKSCSIDNGLCLINSMHTTTAVVINEDESGLKKDIVEKVKQDFPPGAGYHHGGGDSNADAHMASAFTGASRVVPLRNGDLSLGTWQSIFLLELDGPRSRKVLVEILGE